MPDKIMEENKLYIEEWKNFNPNLQEYFFLEGTVLYKDYTKQEQIHLKNIYLPDILKNEKLRKIIHQIDGPSLFEIIRLFTETKEILAKEITPLSAIISYYVDKEKKYIIFEDSEHKKYKYNTSSPEKIIEIYETIKNKSGEVTLQELGSEIKHATLFK